MLHVAVGQRAIRGLEGQAHRKADRTLGHALALIAIEERDRSQRSGLPVAGRSNGAMNDLGGQGLGYDDRQIADDKRMARQLPHPFIVERRELAKAIEVELGHEHAVLPGCA